VQENPCWQKSKCCRGRPSWISKWPPFSLYFALYRSLWATYKAKNGGYTHVCDTKDYIHYIQNVADHFLDTDILDFKMAAIFNTFCPISKIPVGTKW